MGFFLEKNLFFCQPIFLLVCYAGVYITLNFLTSALLTWTCDRLREKLKRQFGCLEQELRMEEIKLAGLFTKEWAIL